MTNFTPEYIFETSWEVCNKIGGIHTVVSTKAKSLVDKFNDNYIVFGPCLNMDNHEFEEDNSLFVELKKLAFKEGIRIRIGRWKIQGSPIAILVDFSSLVPNKDKVLAKLWEDYKVDSISGGWDYIEPILFGKAVAKTIECFVAAYCTPKQKIVAHFHEWMTASGILFLKTALPNVTTIFTTHATVSGRCIAGNGMNLYGGLESFNADEIAHRFNVVPKHSIEKIGALESDCFTTVSDITARECKYLLGKEVDFVTPNGFENSFVPEPKIKSDKRKIAREKMLSVAEVLLSKKFDNDTVIAVTSGRYEFKNKGIDLFIDSLGRLSQNPSLKSNILAFVMVPGWNFGPRKDLVRFIEGSEFAPDMYSNMNLTHYLGDSHADSVLNRLNNNNLSGRGTDNVSVIFVPAYLDGYDGIFNLHYYDMLPGFDVTFFPSYYEPWGYTPLESIAFGVPTVTTSLSGFGKWVTADPEGHSGVEVVERDDYNEDFVVNSLAEMLLEFSTLTETKKEELSSNSVALSQKILWKHLVDNYYNAYNLGIQKTEDKMKHLFLDGGEVHEQVNYIKHQLSSNAPTWTRVIAERALPQELDKLEKLTKNLWWVWTDAARALFESIDSDLWVKVDKNPIALIDNLGSEKLNELASNEAFLAELDNVYQLFENYMSKKIDRPGTNIAYFSMEYGLHSSLKIYSGGLGILAGDYLKEASDQNIPMIAVGLLYRYGYFTQRITAIGEQEATYEAQNFYKLPISPVRDEEGRWKTVTLNYPGREVTARIWCCAVGRTDLYLLDTDHDLNSYEDRTITHHLYGGDWENRLKQEVLLGIGGIKVFEELGLSAEVYHCNEGHAAFTSLRRIETIINKEGLSFSEALEVVRASSLFTTHTPVPAGHDAFPEEMMRQYMWNQCEALKITWEQFISLGRIEPHNNEERFSMSYLACNMASEINGVSYLHGEVSKDILRGMWPGYFPAELHIGYVTNGVHLPTWAATSLKTIYNKIFGESFENYTYDKSVWENIYKVSDSDLWSARLHLKDKLIRHIKARVKDPQLHRLGSPAEIVKITESLKPDVLTIGFARRFATYKRAHLLFTDIDRLDRIVNNPERPVQFVFAGKAHPNDKPGQDLIKHIVEISSLPQFVGKIIFLQNYDMELARRMVQGVDIWMNTPTRPLEASGTSGEKAVMNGVLHFSVLDGWWVEGYKKDAGWALPQERTYLDQGSQNMLDAEMIYTIFEEKIIPAYYDRDIQNVSSKWVSYIKRSISEVASNFTTKRMIEDYVERFYSKLASRAESVTADNFRIAREVAAWKRHISSLWDNNINTISVRTYDMTNTKIMTGETYRTDVVLDLGEISTNDIGVELVIAKQVTDDKHVDITRLVELDLEKTEGTHAFYSANIPAISRGSFDVAIRVYAKNEHLVHRMDFALVKWLNS
ncbi:MAG: alpha-glucan family phosphorylase [Rikenellaceae bacterium]